MKGFDVNVSSICVPLATMAFDNAGDLSAQSSRRDCIVGAMSPTIAFELSLETINNSPSRVSFLRVLHVSRPPLANLS